MVEHFQRFYDWPEFKKVGEMDRDVRKAVRTIEHSGFNGLTNKEIKRFIELASIKLSAEDLSGTICLMKRKIVIEKSGIQVGDKVANTAVFNRDTDGYTFGTVIEMRDHETRSFRVKMIGQFHNGTIRLHKRPAIGWNHTDNLRKLTVDDPGFNLIKEERASGHGH